MTYGPPTQHARDHRSTGSVRPRTLCLVVALITSSLFAPQRALGGFTWLPAAVDMNFNTTLSWTDIDLSLLVPAGATGVVVEIANTARARFNSFCWATGSAARTWRHSSPSTRALPSPGRTMT